MKEQILRQGEAIKTEQQSQVNSLKANHASEMKDVIDESLEKDNDAQDLLGNYESDIADLKSLIEKKESQNKEMADLIQQAKTALSLESKKVQDRDITIQGLQNQLKDLGSVEQERDSTIEQNKELNTQIGYLKDQLEKQKEKFSQENLYLKDQVAEQKDEFKARTQQLLADKDQADKREIDQRGQIVKLDENVTNLMADLRSKDQIVNKLIAEKGNLEQEHSRQLSGLLKTVDDKSKRIDHLTSENSNLAKEMNQEQLKVEQLQLKVEQLGSRKTNSKKA